MNFREWINIDMPDVRQKHKWDCGPTSLFAVCQYYGVGPVNQEDYPPLFKKYGSVYSGVHPRSIVKVAKSLGLNAEFHQHVTLQQLKSWINMKRPVMVEIQAWGKKKNYPRLNDGHFVIAIGYDNKKFIFEDPSIKGSRGYIPTEEFEARWQERETNGDQFYHSAIVFWMTPNTPKHPFKLARLKKLE